MTIKEDIVEENRRQIDRLFGHGSVIVKDPTEGMSQEARREYVAKFAIMLPLLRQELLFAASKEIEDIARFAKDELEMFFRRGGISTIDLLLQHFEGMAAEHQQNSQAEPKPEEPSSVFPRV